METIILNQRQIEQKTNRIARQIVENTFGEDHFYIAGIAGNGAQFARNIFTIVSKLSKQKIEFFEISLDKDFPLNHPIKYDIDSKKLVQSTILLIDDVINSGKTMQYALMKLLEQPVKSVKTVALVDRKHRRYPIKADYVGLTLSTTLQNHVELSYTPEPKAFLR